MNQSQGKLRKNKSTKVAESLARAACDAKCLRGGFARERLNNYKVSVKSKQVKSQVSQQKRHAWRAYVVRERLGSPSHASAA
eukprot:344975-Pleurochrysis_carterae.AAC.6